MWIQKSDRIFGWFVFILWAVLLLRLTVFRPDFLQFPLLTHGEVHLIPLTSYRWLMRHGELYSVIYLFVGNLIWFVPLGFLLPLLTGRPKSVLGVLLVAVLLSVCIEVSQYVFGTGESETDDVILNTLGAAIGYGMYLFYRHFKLNGDQ